MSQAHPRPQGQVPVHSAKAVQQKYDSIRIATRKSLRFFAIYAKYVDECYTPGVVPKVNDMSEYSF